MTHVETLLGPRGRIPALAAESGVNAKTMYSWRKSRAIPPWRRPALLSAVRRLGLELPAEVIVYLASDR